MDVIECLDPNTRKLTNFLNTISDNMPLSIFLHSYPIIHNENDINVLRKINLSILINYMNQENEFKLSIQYPSYSCYHKFQIDDPKMKIYFHSSHLFVVL